MSVDETSGVGTREECHPPDEWGYPSSISIYTALMRIVHGATDQVGFPSNVFETL